MANDGRGTRYHGDEEDLFRAYNDRLYRRVASAVRASPDVIEDACSHAWSQFLAYQPDRDRNWQGWLFRTAQREAWRLWAERGHVIELRDDIFGSGRREAIEPVQPRDPLTVRESLRERLAAMAELPEADRRLVALRAEGYQYEEIAELTGGTYTSVNRGLARANAALRDRLTDQERPQSLRAQRLANLERDAPLWLIECIGSPPRPNRRIGGEGALLAWRRAALAIDDYRRDHDPELGRLSGAEPPQGEAAARAWALARTAAERAQRHRQCRTRDLER
jgi:RNA polymerase sigma factor (sigma-70 family)